MKLLKKTNTWIILTTVVFLALAYLFYLEYYVKSKENSVIETRFRILDQIGDNIDIKLGFYQKNINTLESKAIAEYQKLKNKDQDNIKKKDLLDSLNYAGEVRKDIIAYDILFNNDSTRKEELDSRSNYIKHLDFKENPDIPIKQLIVYIPYDKIFLNANRSDVFDDLIVINNSTRIIYSTLSNDVILTSKDSLLSRIRRSPGKNIKNDQNNVIFSGKAFDIEISNEKFKAFFKPVEIQGMTWYAMGLMQYLKYNAAVRSIPPWIIILLSLLLVFTILALPIVKLKVMTKTESLGTSTLIYSVLSVVLGCALIILFLFTAFYKYSQNQQTNKHLVELSNSIQNSFLGEVCSAYNQLKEYEKHFDVIEDLIADSLANQSNCVSMGINILADNNIIKPSVYPFADYYFWMDENGMQQVYLTPFNYYGTMSDLKSRDYFNKKDEWFFPGSDTAKFRIESIVSVSSGSHKVALSKKSNVKKNTYVKQNITNKCICERKDEKRLPVAAISSRFYSIIDPIIPYNYSFCIIDKSGKVWFHANKTLNLKENFIDECENSTYLQAALYRDLSKTMDVNYYNQSHRIYITPIKTLPLYLVTMYNKNGDKSAQVQVIIITLLLIGLTLLIILIQIIIILLIAHRLQWKLARNLILSMTRPRIRLNDNYVYLTIVNILVAAILIIFLYYLRNMHAVIAIFSMIIIGFSYNHWNLNANQLKQKNRKIFALISVLQLIILNITGYYLVKGLDFVPVLLFNLIILFVLAICHYMLKPMIVAKSRSYLSHYIRYLLAVLFLFIVVPSLKFTNSAYNYEQEIRLKHTQIDLMKQLEIRNKEQAAYYNNIRLTSKFANTVYKKRKYLGIYAGFINTKIDTTNYPFDSIQPVSPNDYWDTLVQYFRTSYKDYITESKYLPFNEQKNEAISWNIDQKGKMSLWYTGYAELPKQNHLFRKKMTSKMEKTGLLFPYSGINHYQGDSILPNLFFWLLTAIIFYFLYLLVRFGARKLFCLEIVENYTHINLAESVKYALENRKNLIISRLSSRDHSQEFYHDFLKDKNPLYLDWSDDESVSNTSKNINSSLISDTTEKSENLETEEETNIPVYVFIDNFDHNFKEVDHFNDKLNILRRWKNHDGLRWIIVTQNHFDKLLNYYSELDSLDNTHNNEKEKYGKIIRQLETVKAEFKEFIYPVSYNWSQYDEDTLCTQPPVASDEIKLIANELNASDYLKQFIPEAEQYYLNHCNNKQGKYNEEKIVNFIGRLAKDYYSDLFSSTDIEEKYVLYDAADNLIINPKNISAINELLRKGLLIRKCDKINFMNISFRKFVANKMNKIEASEIEGKMRKETGSWKGYKIMLILIIIGLFGFIALVNEDFVNDLNQLFVAIGGVIAVITGLLGLLSKKGSSS